MADDIINYFVVGVVIAAIGLVSASIWNSKIRKEKSDWKANLARKINPSLPSDLSKEGTLVIRKQDK